MDLIKIYDYSCLIDQILDCSDIVISMPYTSIATTAHLLNIKSIYYDPSNKLIYDKIAANGVELLSGKTNLKNWFDKKI